MANRSPKFKKLIANKSGIMLDISFGGTPQPNSVSLSPVGDIKRDPRTLPLPLPDACVSTVVITHVLEYLDPQEWFQWWDELHRVMRPFAVAFVSGPYGGDESHGWLSDPTHRTRVIEQSFAWLDPNTPFYEMHATVGRPQPRPWTAVTMARVPGTHGTHSYNVQLQALPVMKEKK